MPENRIPDLSAIGVFHFGSEDRSNPIDSLEIELRREKDSIENALIVLPEGFNVTGGFGHATFYGGKVIPVIRSDLFRLTKQYNVGFVAGLVEETPGSCMPGDLPLNSANLIDQYLESRGILLCHKTCACFEPLCRSAPECLTIPRFYRGLAIAALICNQFMDHTQLVEWSRPIRNRFEWNLSRKRVVCVPASSSITGRLTDEKWGADFCVAAADSYQDLSFVTGRGVTEKRAKGLESDRPTTSAYNQILLSRFQSA